MFLASDLGGYAAVASIWFCTARQKWAVGDKKKSGHVSALSINIFSYPSKLSCPPSLVPCSGILAISVRYSLRKKASVTNSDATSAMG